MKKFWTREPFLVGMVHLLPLPGSPRFEGDPEACLRVAREDARALREGGVQALLIENHGDAPFQSEKVAPHVTAWLSVVARELAAQTGLPIGINCLRNDALAAMGAASAAEAAFIRVNVLVGATATDQGVITGRARDLLDYRRALSAEIAILADLDVKFGTPLYRADTRDMVESLVQRGGADGVIVTGSATGRPPEREQIDRVRGSLAPGVPLFVGSGVASENVKELGRGVTGLIVGTSLKRNGDVRAPVEVTRVKALARRLAELDSEPMS